MAKKKNEYAAAFESMKASKKGMSFPQTNQMSGGKPISKVSNKSFNRKTP